jgi:pyruvate,orthophosphate dikinase
MGISSYEMPPLNYQGNASSLEQAVENYKRVIRSSKGEDFPQDPKEQIRMAIKTVFNSWNSKRAKEYRKISEIDDSLGTAANIQTMVFGNIGYTSGTGVLFTRDTKTGRNVIYGEFLRNAQGPDLVSGNVTPIGRFKEELEKIRPGLYDELKTLTKNLEQNRKNVQDIEFTVEEGVLWMLQRRDARVSAKAAVRIAVDLANEGLIDKETAVRRVHPNQLKGIYSYVIDPKAKKQARAIARGLAASPISSTGQAVFTIDDAVNWQADGKKVILVRVETTPDDIEGITASEGILTSTGGLTCHAALVSNSMGKSCIVGCKELDVDEEKSRAKTGKHLIKKGDYVTLDGSTGDVYKRQLPFVKPKLSRHAKTFLKWIDEMKG